MQVLDAAGKPLNATFSAEPEAGWVALIMESRSGRAAGRPGRNADYNPALTVLLSGWPGLTPPWPTPWSIPGRHGPWAFPRRSAG